MPAIKVLTDHVKKLKADNEYLERQILFLGERVAQYREAVGTNNFRIINLERTINHLKDLENSPFVIERKIV